MTDFTPRPVQMNLDLRQRVTLALCEELWDEGHIIQQIQAVNSVPDGARLDLDPLAELDESVYHTVEYFGLQHYGQVS